MKIHGVALILALNVFVLSAAAHARELDPSRLPTAWNLEQTIIVPEADLPGFRSRLGVPVAGITNYILDAGGIRLQVNVLSCSTDQLAAKVHKRLKYAHQGKDCMAMDGTDVFEILCGNDLVAAKARDLMDLVDPATVIWKARFEVAPLESCDPMVWNRLFNLLNNYRADPESEDLKASIAETAAQFTFCNSVSLRTPTPNWGAPEYAFSADVSARKSNGDVTTFDFQKLPHDLDIPCLTIDAVIPVKPFAYYAPDVPVDCEALLQATDYWPVQEAKIAAIVKETVTEEMDVEAIVEALLNWRRKNIQFGGDVVGSRYGPLKVLEQGCGHCGDHCDLLITLLRNAKIPARLVLGWVPSMGAGHFWVEAYVKDKGWLSVDATTSWLGISAGYVPFVISETGDIPYVYWSIPDIRKK